MIGAGLMGHGIALEFAARGLEAALVDKDEISLEQARKRVSLGLDLLVESGITSPSERSSVPGRITYTSDLEEACANADLIIEAVFEDLELKRSLLRRAASAAPAHAVFASNTSSFMPSQLADATDRLDRFAIAHYFNPPYLLPLVEIVPAPEVEHDVIEILRTLYVDIGKRPIVIREELPGFVANRLQAALSREAAALVQQGIGSPQDIDDVVKYSIGRRLAVAGPFEIWEQAGWDLISTIVGELFGEIDNATGPSQLMLDAVGRGDLGVKTGRGMYDWTPESAEALRLRIGRALIRLAQMEKGLGQEHRAGDTSSNSAMIDKSSDSKKIAVIGAGLMGHGIALEFAAQGHDVTINDVSEELLNNAMERAEIGLKVLADTGRISPEQVDSALKRIRASADLQGAVEDADFVIEATTEDLNLKRRIFADLDRFCQPHTVLLSNTSTFLPSAVAANVNRRDRIAVAHYFNPPHLLPLVEVVRGPETSQQTVDATVELLESVGKRPVVLQKEIQGFVSNRLQAAIFREALHIVSSGGATTAEVDEIVRSSFGRRLSVAGPFELRELIGLDLALDIGKQIRPSLNNTREVPPLLADKVAAGHLGTKTGKGFYDWTPKSAEALRSRVASALADIASWGED